MAANTTEYNEKEDIFKLADKHGRFVRKASQFRNNVVADPNADFPAESGRYVLYLNLGCPWYENSSQN